MRKFFRLLIALGFLGFCAHSRLEAEDDPASEWVSYLRFMPSRGVEAMSGRVRLTQVDSEYSYEFKALGKLPVEFSLDTQYIGIENTTAVNLPAHLTGVSFGLEATLPFFNFSDTYFRFGLEPGFYTDDWSFNSSSFRIPTQYFLIREANEKLTLIAGVAVYPDYQRQAWPILGFIYKPNERLEFNITPKKPNVSYILNEKISLFAEGGFSYKEFEVSKDNRKGLVLRYNETHLGAGIKYKFNRFLDGSLSLGGVFNRKLQYRDSLGKVSIENGLYTEFRIESNF